MPSLVGMDAHAAKTFVDDRRLGFATGYESQESSASSVVGGLARQSNGVPLPSVGPTQESLRHFERTILDQLRAQTTVGAKVDVFKEEPNETLAHRVHRLVVPNTQ